MKRNKNNSACKFRIGNNIRKWRNIKDIKQKELASALEISEAAVSNMENDVCNITVSQLEEISVILNVSIEQLLSDPQEKFRISSANNYVVNEKEEQFLLDKEILYAIISSMEKKDQQLQELMQNCLHAITKLTKDEPFTFNSSKQVTSRA